MKGAKCDKAIKKIINTTKAEEYHEGALEVRKHVKALYGVTTDSPSWELGQIIAVRPINDSSFLNKKKKNDYSYDYYIHYVNFNRRMDTWLSRNQIEIDEKFVDEELLKKDIRDKEKSIFNNDEHAGLDKNSLISHEEATKVKTISEIEMGQYKSDCWYFSPYPEGYHNIKCLFICEFCLNFYVEKSEMKSHLLVCPFKHPPGNEIYRDNNISVFEVDGRKEKIYCENLCYLGKLFLDHKTLQWDVEPFLFYILCEYDDYGYHFVGYFSKEKESNQDFNVACILTMPFHQRKGYGKFLIDFSYLLSKKEGKIASPEVPLSDLGFSTYFSYWTQTVINVLLEFTDQTITIKKISEMTSIREVDISRVLEDLTLMRNIGGNHIVIADKRILSQLYKKAGKPGHPVYSEKLIWTPYKLRYELG